MSMVLTLGPSNKAASTADIEALESLMKECEASFEGALFHLEAFELVIVVDDCPGCGAPWDAYGARLTIEESSRMTEASEGDLEDHALEHWLDQPPFNEGQRVLWGSGKRRCRDCWEP